MTTTRKDGWTVSSMVALALLASTACGGAGNGMDGSGATRAAVTARGPVKSSAAGLEVNGIAFRTSGAALRDDGGASSTLSGEAELRGRVAEGELVTVRGRLDDSGASGEATEIEVHHSVEGELEAKAPGRIVVGGATVSVDDSTVVSDRSGARRGLDDLAIGERVEISGHGDGHGGLRATSVRSSAAAAGSERELRAWVVAVSGTIVDLSFSPGGDVAVRVDVGGISPAPALGVGTLVEVRTTGSADANGVLTATAIHAEHDLHAEAGERVEVEGIVTAADASGFSIGAQRVRVGPGTELRGGTADDVVPGAEVEVEGVLGDDGVLDAREVELEANARIDANASAVDPSAATITVLGLAVHVTPSTELRNVTSLASLTAGAHLEIRGQPTRDGAGLNATRIELLGSPADRAFLRGVVSAKTPTSSLDVLGLSIDTAAAEFRDTSDAAMGAAAFFDAILPGRTIVKVRWRPYPASTSEPADEAELEN